MNLTLRGLQNGKLAAVSNIELQEYVRRRMIDHGKLISERGLGNAARVTSEIMDAMVRTWKVMSSALDSWSTFHD